MHGGDVSCDLAGHGAIVRRDAHGRHATCPGFAWYRIVLSDGRCILLWRSRDARTPKACDSGPHELPAGETASGAAECKKKTEARLKGADPYPILGRAASYSPFPLPSRRQHRCCWPTFTAGRQPGGGVTGYPNRQRIIPALWSRLPSFMKRGISPRTRWNG